MNAIEFYKYEGTGNDFIVIDCTKFTPDSLSSNEFISNLCDRKKGVGADGLILVQKDNDQKYHMVYFNSDGNESSMCGNGGRCFSHFIKFKGFVSEDFGEFVAIDGLHQFKLNGLNVSLKMRDVSEVLCYNDDLTLDTGSPHYVKFVDKLNLVDVYSEGKATRNSKSFYEKGINVNFVEELEGEINCRTYERGVENETLSCGTGVTAVALACHQKGIRNSPVEVVTPGGSLVVEFEYENGLYHNIWLSGPVNKVFKGDING